MTKAKLEVNVVQVRRIATKISELLENADPRVNDDISAAEREVTDRFLDRTKSDLRASNERLIDDIDSLMTEMPVYDEGEFLKPEYMPTRRAEQVSLQIGQLASLMREMRHNALSAGYAKKNDISVERDANAESLKEIDLRLQEMEQQIHDISYQNGEIRKEISDPLAQTGINLGVVAVSLRSIVEIISRLKYRLSGAEVNISEASRDFESIESTAMISSNELSRSRSNEGKRLFAGLRDIAVKAKQASRVALQLIRTKLSNMMNEEESSSPSKAQPEDDDLQEWMPAELIPQKEVSDALIAAREAQGLLTTDFEEILKLTERDVVSFERLSPNKPEVFTRGYFLQYASVIKLDQNIVQSALYYLVRQCRL